jgi:hypothetical protein
MENALEYAWPGRTPRLIMPWRRSIGTRVGRCQRRSRPR